jgi:hypothetical protein
MLDEFLAVAYAEEMQKQAQAEKNYLFSQLPVEDLQKIASGVPLKEACMCGDGESFLDKFKGTPFLPQAVALEQEMLQTEMLEQQKRVEDRERRASEDNVWDARDRIRLKKKLLELELAKSQGGSPDAPAQGAGAPGDVPSEGVQEDSQGLGGMVAKTSSAGDDIVRSARFRKAEKATKDVPWHRRGQAFADAYNKKEGSAEEKLSFADSVGRRLVREQAEKVAHEQTLISVGQRAGELMAKSAGLGGLNKALFQGAKSIGGMVAKNPHLLGTAAGAGIGALAGGPDHRLSGAAMGAMGGHMLTSGSTGKILSSGLSRGAGEVAAARKVVKPAAGMVGAAEKALPAAEGAAMKALPAAAQPRALPPAASSVGQVTPLPAPTIQPGGPVAPTRTFAEVQQAKQLQGQLGGMEGITGAVPSPLAPMQPARRGWFSGSARNTAGIPTTPAPGMVRLGSVRSPIGFLIPATA